MNKQEFKQQCADTLAAIKIYQQDLRDSPKSFAHHKSYYTGFIFGIYFAGGQPSDWSTIFHNFNIAAESINVV